MSLLMKALEKAARDRVEGKAEPGAPAGAPQPGAVPAMAELTLEPAAPPARKPEMAALTLEAPPPPAPSKPQPAQAAAPAPKAAAPQPAEPPPAAKQAQQQARAATVVRASAAAAPVPRGAGFMGKLLARPLYLFGIIAGLFATGFGVYVYLQITNPALFLPKPPPRPAQPPATPVAAPAPAPAAPIAIADVVAPAAEKEAVAAAPPAPKPPAPQPAAAAPPEPPQIRDRIVVSPSTSEAKVNPLAAAGYAALESGNLEQAQRIYGELSSREPQNIDALFGLAAIAVQQGRSNEAMGTYLRILELQPRNTLAQSAIISLVGRADPLAAESRLKQLIAREPSAFLYFTLGNLYADQNQWNQAQQAYFQAHHSEPSNPDYAYNLAVGLEHLGQGKLALGFYRRAVQLASGKPRVNFSQPAAEERIRKLAAALEQ